MTKVAVLGAGHWGPNLIRNLHDPPASAVTWVVDKDLSRLRSVRERLPEARTGQDARAALRDPAVDAVVIATPTTTHYALAREALERGKDVLVEKPMTSDLGEARRLRSLAERKKRVLMVGHVFLFNAGVRYIKRCLDKGDVGEIHYISMSRTNLGPIRMDVNAAWDLATHDISIANYWLGSTPLTVSAVGGAWINPGLEDAVFATFRYPGSILVNLHASWLNPSKVREATIIGEKKMLTFDDMDVAEPVRIFDKRVGDQKRRPFFPDSFASFRASILEGDVTIPKIQPEEPLKAQCSHFLDCVRTRRKPLSGGEEGLAVVRALAAIERSLKRSSRETPV